MPYICYEAKKFKPEGMSLLMKADAVLKQYAKEGYDVTLRQLYYHFVAHDLFPDTWKFSWDTAKKKWFRDLDNGTKNAEPNYKNFGNLLNDGRMAGVINWNHLVDRTRNLRSHPSWETPSDIVESAANSFRLDKWKNQSTYVEVWVEKDALVGVIERPCAAWQVPFFACRGYTSQSEMWVAGQRLKEKRAEGKDVLVIHLGDHDPSGVDMTRDIDDRLDQFALTSALEIDRIALNMDQVNQYNPPPNPTKMTDTRANDYVDRFGEECWELDALDVKVIHKLVDDRIKSAVNHRQWEKDVAEETKHRERLSDAASRWPEIVEFLS